MTSLDRALDVIEYVAERGAVRVGALSSDMGLPRPTAHRLLSVLVDRGFLEHDEAAHLYRPGHAMTRMGARMAASSLVQFAEPALVRLREETKETVNLAVIRGGRIVYAETLDGMLFPKMSVAVGQDAPAHATAVGKALLAALSEPHRSHFLGPEPYASYTAKTITTRSSLDHELELISRRGYAIDNEETAAGAVCIAAVVNGHTERPFGAMSVSATTSRFQLRDWERLGRLVTFWAGYVSETLMSAQSSAAQSSAAQSSSGQSSSGRLDPAGRR